VALHTLYLVRHGQYDELDDNIGGGGLTLLGRRQASLVAKALSVHKIRHVYTSTMRRAVETAAIVARSFPHATVQKMGVLCEGVPTRMRRMPEFAAAARIRSDRKRADAAFARLFRPVRESRADLVIAHGNIIRYFVCRALGVEPITWVKLGSTHCSVTEVVIEPSGYMRLRSFNETQHLPKAMRTLSLAVMKPD